MLDFGTTGKLRNSDLAMYDRQSESWWQQFTGDAIVGTMTGRQLRLMPSRLESFERFRLRFPQGRVLVPGDPNARNYGRNPYVGYVIVQRRGANRLVDVLYDVTFAFAFHAFRSHSPIHDR